MPRLLPSALLLASVLACSGDDGADPDELLAPPPAGQGVQFAMTHTIAAGVEGEWCRFVAAPAEELMVYRDEVRFSAGSHHFLLYETSYTSIPTMKDDGTPVDTSGVFDCSDGATSGWSVTRLIGGSQNGDGDSILDFPDGVAMAVRPGAVLLMNAHYLNASDAPLSPEVRINLWTRPRAEVTTEGDILFLYNPVIKVPANGDGRARWRCPVSRDITITNLQSHMHKRGVGYEARITDGAVIYQSDAWQHVPVERFPGGLAVPAGASLDYYCDYRNAEARTVYQGPRTTDEMCMLIGSYYPADRNLSNCLDADGAPAGEWIGNGTATCAATMTCLQSAGGLTAAIDCMDAASPTVSRSTSAVLNCLISRANPGVACADQIAACQAE